ncbi:MAG: hypothetical protein HZA48_07470 [Planctomycetes bacterium]|nr:hypothetical protein [Planctomycetota bacterium]
MEEFRKDGEEAVENTGSGLAGAEKTDTFKCSLCEQEKPRAEMSFINAKRFCAECKQTVLSEAEAQIPGGIDIVKALGGALGAAIIGGIVWGLIVIFLNLEVGYAAVGIGALAGYGVVLTSGKKRGLILQVMACAASVFGIVIGKYIAFQHIIKQVAADKGAGEWLSQVSMPGLFFETASDWFSGFDILWVVLAVVAAYKIPAMVKLNVSERKMRP